MNSFDPSKTIAVFGATRGLGLAMAQIYREQGFQVLSLSRSVGESFPGFPNGKKFDASKPDQWSQILNFLQQSKISRWIYAAGGGPYGNFQDKEWKDHEWALNVSFRFPAFLAWHFLSPQFQHVQQMAVIGSSVAEDHPDPKAAMYCASKHALKGLILSLQQESPQRDLRLLSPPYMDTSMLPVNAWPRQHMDSKNLVQDPHVIAQLFCQSLEEAPSQQNKYLCVSIPKK